MSGRARVAIVEDDFLIADYLASLCEDLGAEPVGHAADGDAARDLLAQVRPTHVLMDVRLHGTEDGVSVALWAYAELPGTRIIFITGSNEPSTIERIHSDHPYRILIKPIGPEDLREALA